MNRTPGMKDLFGDTPYVPKDPHQLVRRTDPGTSFQAAAAVAPKLREIQKVVLEHLRAAGARGMTDLDLQTECGDHGSTFRTRRSELVDLGLVRDSGRRLLQDGRKRIVWVIA